MNFGAALASSAAGFLQLAGGVTLGIGLLPGGAVAPDLEFQFFAERVHHGNPHAVQTAGNFVGGGIKLAAGVQLGHHHLRSGNFFAVNVHGIDGNAAAVIDDRNRIVDVDGSVDSVGVAGQRLVDRVIDDFIHQVM